VTRSLNPYMLILLMLGATIATLSLAHGWERYGYVLLMAENPNIGTFCPDGFATVEEVTEETLTLGFRAYRIEEGRAVPYGGKTFLTLRVGEVMECPKCRIRARFMQVLRFRGALCAVLYYEGPVGLEKTPFMLQDRTRAPIPDLPVEPTRLLWNIAPTRQAMWYGEGYVEGNWGLDVRLFTGPIETAVGRGYVFFRQAMYKQIHVIIHEELPTFWIALPYKETLQRGRILVGGGAYLEVCYVGLPRGPEIAAWSA